MIITGNDFRRKSLAIAREAAQRPAALDCLPRLKAGIAMTTYAGGVSAFIRARHTLHSVNSPISAHTTFNPADGIAPL